MYNILNVSSDFINNKSILITGGTGTVGKALISQNDNEYISISRNEENIANVRRLYPEVKCYVGNIEDKSLLLRVF